jgi:ribonuclease BN (tRNA processing enzyme)
MVNASRHRDVMLRWILVQALGLKTFSSILVQHCKHSFGLVLEEASSGAKFVFSGDTERCDNVIQAARGAAILVHEATFENDRAEDARHKKHSTISQALEVCTTIKVTSGLHVSRSLTVSHAYACTSVVHFWPQCCQPTNPRPIAPFINAVGTSNCPRCALHV